jgi:membrane-associated phospholipid phosphatase
MEYPTKQCNERNLIAFLIPFLFLCQNGLAIEGGKDTALVPITKIFSGIGQNAIGSFEYNYGLNYFVAGIGTFGIVKSGFDWKWYRNAQDHPWLPNAGFVAVGVGPLASIAVPLGLYLYGRSNQNVELQLTGLALGQAAILGGVISSTMKAFTGRVPPNEHKNLNDYSQDFRFGFLRGGVYQGWPSSHTCTAFAMAVTLIKLYPDDSTIKIAGLTYASLIGLGVSTNIHWFSDAFAGALIGYAIGESVGSGYWNLMHGGVGGQSYGFFVTPIGVGFMYRF